jgi:hypothetical protein
MEPMERKGLKEFRAFREIPDRKESKEFKAFRGLRAILVCRASKAILVRKEFRGFKESKEIKEIPVSMEPMAQTVRRDRRVSKENRQPLTIVTRLLGPCVLPMGLLLRMLCLPLSPFRPSTRGYKLTRIVISLRKRLSREIPIVPL